MTRSLGESTSSTRWLGHSARITRTSVPLTVDVSKNVVTLNEHSVLRQSNRRIQCGMTKTGLGVAWGIKQGWVSAGKNLFLPHMRFKPV